MPRQNWELLEQDTSANEVNMSGALSSFQPYVRSVLRIIAGLTFSMHGYQKLLGAFGGHKVEAYSLFWTAGLIESLGGTLIILGLFTTPVAFILCGEMAVAYFKAHFPRGFLPIVNGGELAVLYCFVFLYLFTAGPGNFSLDHVLRKKPS
jgi:putative oxidoreductase